MSPMKCQHQWRVVVNEKHLSPLAEALLVQKGAFECSGGNVSATKIVILACEKCGKIDKTITKL